MTAEEALDLLCNLPKKCTTHDVANALLALPAKGVADKDQDGTWFKQLDDDEIVQICVRSV